MTTSPRLPSSATRPFLHRRSRRRAGWYPRTAPRTPRAARGHAATARQIQPGRPALGALDQPRHQRIGQARGGAASSAPASVSASASSAARSSTSRPCVRQLPSGSRGSVLVPRARWQPDGSRSARSRWQCGSAARSPGAAHPASAPAVGGAGRRPPPAPAAPPRPAVAVKHLPGQHTTARLGLARDLPETAPRLASCRPTTQPSAASLTCAVMWRREVLQGVVNRRRIDGKDGVAGSIPAGGST